MLDVNLYEAGRNKFIKKFIKKRNFAAALRSYNQSIFIDPELHETRIAVSLAHLKNGGIDSAIKHLRRALILDPKFMWRKGIRCCGESVQTRV